MSNSDQQPFPRLGTPLVQEDRRVSIPWYRLFITLWIRSGGAFIPTSGAVVLVNSPGGVQAIDAATGAFLGYIIFTSSVPPAPSPLAPGASPFVYQASVPGTLVVTSAQVEVSRNAGVTWYIVSPMGGSVPLQIGDRARMTWFGVDPPTVTWFPNQ